MADCSSETLIMRRVLVTGASSQIGVFAIPRLLNAGFNVVAVSRQPRPEYLPESDQLEWLDFEQAMQAQNTQFQNKQTQDKNTQDKKTQDKQTQDLQAQDKQTQDLQAPASNPCKYLLSAGPMSLAVKVLRTSTIFKQAVIFSSSSVITKRDSPDPTEKKLIEGMRKLESDLTTLASKQDLRMVIFRPTLIYGCGLDQNISRLAALIQRYGFMPVNGEASGLRQPVHADDLARVAVNALVFEQEMPPKLLLAGGSTLSYTEMVEAIFDAFQKPARIVHLPQWLLIPAVSVLRLLGLAGGVSVAMVRRQLLDQIFDNLPAQQLLNYRPRPFEPTKKDFERPDKRQHSSH